MAHPERQRKPRYRPPRRPCRIEIHVDEAELAVLRERAARYTHGVVSKYMRDASLRRRMDPQPPPPPTINQDAYMAFLRVGGLLNQAMHHLNAGNIWTTPQQLADFRRQLADLDAAVQDVRRLLARPAA